MSTLGCQVSHIDYNLPIYHYQSHIFSREYSLYFTGRYLQINESTLNLLCHLVYLSKFEVLNLAISRHGPLRTLADELGMPLNDR